MINLAGNKEADRFIEEELYLAGIPLLPKKSEGEVSSLYYGRQGKWTFRRAWYYYVASCLEGLGIPYNMAVELHERKYPVSDSHYTILGQVIRVDGHAGHLHPKEFEYPTLDNIKQEVKGAKKQYPSVNFNANKSFDRSALRELDGIKYIRLYHIDTQIGLKELANKIRAQGIRCKT